MANRVKTLLEDKALRESMSKAGREETERWSWEAATSVLRNVQYQKVGSGAQDTVGSGLCGCGGGGGHVFRQPWPFFLFIFVFSTVVRRSGMKGSPASRFPFCTSGNWVASRNVNVWLPSSLETVEASTTGGAMLPRLCFSCFTLSLLNWSVKQNRTDEADARSACSREWCCFVVDALSG